MVVIPKPIFNKKLSKISWIKIYAREYGVQYSEMAILCLSPKAKYHIPFPSVNQIVIPEGNNTAFYIDRYSWKKLVNSLNNKYTHNLNRLDKYEKEFEKDGTIYLKFTQKIAKLNVKKESNSDLLKLYIDYQKKLFAYSVFVWTSFILNNFVAERAVNIIDKYLRKHKMGNKKQEILDTLLQPAKKTAVIRLQNLIQKYAGKLSKDKFRKIYLQYRWLSCLDLHNEPWTKQQFTEAINIFIRQPFLKSGSFTNNVNKLKINKKDVDYLLMTRQLVYIKDARDDFRRKGIYFMMPFFAEIAKRMKIRSKDISYVKSNEVINFLKNNLPISSQLIQERKKAFIMYLDNKSNIVCKEGKYIHNLLREFNLINIYKGRKTIKGNVASQGKARGLVAIIYGVKDLHKVKDGYILVAVTTHPDYTIAMRKAAAIITDEGGITSHAAIVSREYGIPCIVGAQNATKLLRDGDEVEVNAVDGYIKIC